ncbi:hypothetical protein [Rhodohalobacter mucosus]|uniref:Uncharacterized protein n=1 Tax=Rhodohalobacter mucosus TaxID=2079485 RepID=A0A316TW31_9BACT|nr:hypothetical protein [Rhodohalobacter mucosus]PWN07395.1 hypothetical protein DDZ15_03780 [Rhodohalobacter mucosus]
MVIFKKYKTWWFVLFVLTIAVSFITAGTPSFTGLLFSMLGHFAFAAVVSIPPLIFYWFIKKPLSPEEYMATFTVAWLILAVANLLVM